MNLQVVEATVYLFRFRLEKPFRIATEVTQDHEEVLLRLTDAQGHVGWGEASPSPVILGATSATILAALDSMVPLVLGEDPRRLRHLVEKLDRVWSGQAAAKAAIDLALHDLVGQIHGEPVWRMLGGSQEPPLDTDYTVTLDNPQTMAAEAKDLVAQGFHTIKVKVGLDPKEDVERVRAIRRAVGDAVALRIDANQGWTRTEAVWALERMGEYEIEFVEQPVPAWDLAGLAWVRQRSPIPVMADESVHSPANALQVVRAEAADFVNIKLMKAGGLVRALEIASICQAGGIPCMIGSMVESNLSATAAVHFALAHPNIAFRDLDTGHRPESWIVAEGASSIRAPWRVLPDPQAPGFGFQRLFEDRLIPVKSFRLGQPSVVHSTPRRTR